MREVAIGGVLAGDAGVRGYVCRMVACADAGFAGGLRISGMMRNWRGFRALDYAGVGWGRLELAHYALRRVGVG